MKRYLLFISALVMSLLSCEQNNNGESLTLKTDTIPPVIKLWSDSVETILLQVSSTTLISNGASSYTWLPGNSSGDYVDEVVNILDDVNGEMLCVDLPLETQGTVNNKVAGNYTLTYNTKDAAGNKAKTLKRIVRVIENEITFLNGEYSAVCTCTALLKDLKIPEISKSKYTTNVTASSIYNNQFELSHLRIGDYFVRPSPLRPEGNNLEVHFYDPAFNVSGNFSTGTLSASKKSFTIETTVYLYSPDTKYTCQNIFKKVNQ